MKLPAYIFFNIKCSAGRLGRKSWPGSQGHWSLNKLHGAGWSQCIRAACSTDPLPQGDGQNLTAPHVSSSDSRGHRATSTAANVKLKTLEHSGQRLSLSARKFSWPITCMTWSVRAVPVLVCVWWSSCFPSLLPPLVLQTGNVLMITSG